MPRVQFNLLPDVKLDYVRTQRVRQTVTTTSIALTLTAVAIFVIMLGLVYGVQKKQLSDAGKSVEEASRQIKDIPNVETAVTVQNQLQALVGLHQSKHITSRIFTYLEQLTPANLSIGKFDMDITTNTMNISGNADAQRTVNAFIDTLKATTYKVGNSAPKSAFLSVIESDFAINPGNVSYTLDLQFDPNLFTNTTTDEPQLIVPKTQQTHQSDIFREQTGGR